MSLTSHLDNKNSPIGQFIKQHFAHTSMLTKEPNRQLKNVHTYRPILQSGEQYPYGLLGTAIDYRIRYIFGITPYQRLVAWQGAMKLIAKAWESDNDIPLDWENIPQQHVSLYEKARHVLCMTNHLHFIRGMQCFVGRRFYRGTVPHHVELLVAAPGLSSLRTKREEIHPVQASSTCAAALLAARVVASSAPLCALPSPLEKSVPNWPAARF